jgi:hypothetical protein
MEKDIKLVEAYYSEKTTTTPFFARLVSLLCHQKSPPRPRKTTTYELPQKNSQASPL